MIDFSNPAVKENFFERINKARKGVMQIPTKKYWFDF